MSKTILISGIITAFIMDFKTNSPTYQVAIFLVSFAVLSIAYKYVFEESK